RVGYDVRAEWDTHRPFRIGKPGDVNYDLWAKRSNSETIWEMKYLKKANDQRVIKDFVKLVLPETVRRQLLFLVAYEGTLKSTLLDRIRRFRTIQFWIARSEPENPFVCRSFLSDDTKNELEPLSGDNMKAVQKCISLLGRSQEVRFRVEFSAEEADGS